jgi:hypothetical protein
MPLLRLYRDVQHVPCKKDGSMGSFETMTWQSPVPVLPFQRSKNRMYQTVSPISRMRIGCTLAPLPCTYLSSLLSRNQDVVITNVFETHGYMGTVQTTSIVQGTALRQTSGYLCSPS